MFGKLVIRSDPKSTPTVLPRAQLLAAASMLALGAVAFTVATPQPAFAFICDQPTNDTDGASDNGANSNTACGKEAMAWNSGAHDSRNSAFGGRSQAGDDGTTSGQDNTAVGARASAGFGTSPGGDENSAFGEFANAGSDGTNENTALGAHSSAQGGSATAVGFDARASAGAVAIGAGSRSSSIAIGTPAFAENDGIAIGDDAEAGTSGGGDDNIALGNDARAGVGGSSEQRDNIAIGNRAEAGVDSDTHDNLAIGHRASAEGVGSPDDGHAIALGAHTSAGFFQSTAIGVGASTDRANQMVFGTEDTSYTAPGITSDASRGFQSGPLEVVTTDADGNLASDGGTIFRDIEENTEGIAIAMALENPDLKGDETFGIAVNGGYFEGEYAVAGAVMLSLVDDLLGPGKGGRLSLAGGGGYGLDHQTVGARAGIQFTW